MRAQAEDLCAEIAAFAKADTIHVHLRLDPGRLQVARHGQDVPLPERGYLDAPLLINDDPVELTRIQSVQLDGTGIQTKFDDTALVNRYPGSTNVPALANASYSCSEVAAGRYPTRTPAVVTVVPESGRVHRLKLPLAAVARQTVLEACLLPDPDAVPVVSIEEQHNRLLLLVHSIFRSLSSLRSLSITSVASPSS